MGRMPGHSDTPKPRRPRVTDRDRPIFDAGIAEGREQMQKEVLSILQVQFMDPDIASDSVEGQAILAVARGLSEQLREANDGH